MLPARISTVSIDVDLEHRKGAISTGANKFIEVLAQFMVFDFIIYYTSAHLNSDVIHNERYCTQ